MLKDIKNIILQYLPIPNLLVSFNIEFIFPNVIKEITDKLIPAELRANKINILHVVSTSSENTS